MQGLKRKVVYVALYEAIAILASGAGLAAMSGRSAAHAGALAVATSVVAVLWNLIFNTLFEAWEARQAKRGRSVARRMAHAVGFEGGLIIVLVPLFAWWLDVNLWQALLMNASLMLFFLIYMYAFNWSFDRIFGLPTAAASR